MPESAVGGAHARPARVVSGVDPEFLEALAGTGTPPPVDLGAPAAKSLHALVAVLVSEEVGDAPIQLHLVLPRAAEAAVPQLYERIAGQLPQGRLARVVPLVVGDDVGGDLGEQAEVFSPGVEVGGAADPVRVVVNGAAGDPDVRRALTAVADAWGVATLLASDGDVYARRPLGDMTSSRMLDALRFALTAERTPANDVAVLSRGFEGLLRREATRYAATLTLDTLLREPRFIGLPDHFSACAELLRRHGEHRLADDLRRLIDHWVRHRIWSVNYVSEMVLHDETHSAAVDRNVASLCEELLAAGRLDPWDVFVLALCAWLHDWGHASARMDPEIPTDPVEVRSYHGYLTAVRLLQEPAQHAITDDLVPAGLRPEGTEYGLVDEVALLCSHHQGWTSCSDLGSEATDEFRPLPAFSVFGGASAETDRQDARMSFHADFGRRFGDRRGNDDYARLQRLLAILRLADASDVGAHRVPDYATQSSNRTARHDGFLAQIGRMLRLRSGAASLASRQEGALSEDERSFVKVTRDYESLLARCASHPVWKDDEVEVFVAEFVKKNKLSAWDEPRSAEDPPGTQLVGWAWQYSKHVATQVAYYQHHHRVRAVIPVLRPVDGRLRIELNVLPLDRAEIGDGATPEEVAEAVAKDVVREYGGKVKGGTVVVDRRGKPHKAHLTAVLNELDIDPRWVDPRPYVPRIAVAGGEPAGASATAERRRVPYAPSAGSPVAWCGWGPAGPALAPLASAAGAGRGDAGPTAPPVALTSDGVHSAACVEGMLTIADVATGKVLRRLRVADRCAVLALRRGAAGFTLVLTKGEEVLTAWVGAGSGSRVTAAHESTTPVRAVHVHDAAHTVAPDGTVTGPYADWLLPAGEAHGLDAVPVVDRVLWALVPAASPTQVRVWSALPAADPARLEDVQEEKGPDDDGRPVSDLAWVREPRDTVARLVVVRDGVATVHPVAVQQ